MDKPHVVVVDDDPDLCEGLQNYLSANGLEVSTAEGGAALRQILATARVDLVLLDLNMPGEDGLALTRLLRQQPGIGIVILTGAGHPIDRVVGLELGADDYIAKPFDPRELLARVRSVLRRLQVTASAESPPTGADSIAVGPYTLNLKSRMLVDAHDTELPLTTMEFDLLRALAGHPNQILSRDQLQAMAYNRRWDPLDRSIDVRITRLRRKIEVDPLHPRIIRTIRGKGYMFVPAS